MPGKVRASSPASAGHPQKRGWERSEWTGDQAALLVLPPEEADPLPEDEAPDDPAEEPLLDVEDDPEPEAEPFEDEPLLDAPDSDFAGTVLDEPARLSVR
jgi:hypothetical protein